MLTVHYGNGDNNDDDDDNDILIIGNYSSNIRKDLDFLFHKNLPSSVFSPINQDSDNHLH